MDACRYLVAADNYRTGETLDRLGVAPSPRMLCVWAQYHPDAVTALKAAPVWLAKVALAGDQWRAGQCDHCACRENGEPVEKPTLEGQGQ